MDLCFDFRSDLRLRFDFLGVLKGYLSLRAFGIDFVDDIFIFIHSDPFSIKIPFHFDVSRIAAVLAGNRDRRFDFGKHLLDRQTPLISNGLQGFVKVFADHNTS